MVLKYDSEKEWSNFLLKRQKQNMLELRLKIVFWTVVFGVYMCLVYIY